MSKMHKILIVDGGARGHALAHAYRSYFQNIEVVVAPGNAGILHLEERAGRGDKGRITTDISGKLKDPKTILTIAENYKPDLIDVAQDDALAMGTVDLLTSHGFRAFGPTREAARIEWDKAWARNFMAAQRIPHPAYNVFEQSVDDEVVIADACERLKTSPQVFFKAAGLYAGKGVLAAGNEAEARLALAGIRRMGDASKTFLVEEGMVGEEFSFYAMVDGKNYVTFKSAQDNKRLLEGDKGPNTGGMGAHAPALVTKGLEDIIQRKIIEPTVRGLAENGTPYTGILYVGGMVCDDGSVKVVEFNSRWGDPECHVILPGIQTSYFGLVNAAMEGRLEDITVEEDTTTRVCVIGASDGYPDNPQKGKRVTIGPTPLGVRVLSAGLTENKGELYSNGGRLFSVVAAGRTAFDARKKALQTMAGCTVEDNTLRYRTDIAWRDVERQR